MKNPYCIFLVLLALGSHTLLAHHPDPNPMREPMPMHTSPDSLLRHVVLFSFKEDTTPEKIKEIEAAFAGLQKKIPQIHAFEWGLNNSPEGLNKGFTHCFLLTFRSEEDRAVYLPHPDHKAFGELLGSSLADVLVIDYWGS